MQTLKQKKKGLQGTAMAVIVVLVVLYVGIYMISKVSNITALQSTDPMYSTQTSLNTNVGTTYQVLFLLVIIAVLAVAIGYLNRFGGSGAAAGA